MNPRLSTELEAAVLENSGVLRVPGERDSYVVMTLQAYRDIAGVGTEAELAESLGAVAEGLADIEAGRTRPYQDVLAELRRRNDLPD
jgi:hypothetical protein